MALCEVSLFRYQMTTTSAVNRNLAYVIEINPLIIYELIKSYIIFA